MPPYRYYHTDIIKQKSPCRYYNTDFTTQISPCRYRHTSIQGNESKTRDINIDDRWIQAGTRTHAHSHACTHTHTQTDRHDIAMMLQHLLYGAAMSRMASDRGARQWHNRVVTCTYMTDSMVQRKLHAAVEKDKIKSVNATLHQWLPPYATLVSWK